MGVLVEPAGMPAPSQGLQLAQVARLLRRNLPLIAILAAAGVVAAYGYARTLPKYYTSTSLIAVEGDRFAIPELQGALSAEGTADPLPGVRTEMQALTSRDLVLLVIDKLKLDSLPEFNSDLRPASLTQRLKSAFQSLLPAAPDGPAGAAGPLEGVLSAVTRQIKIFQDNRSLAIEVSFVSEDPKLSADVVNDLVAEYVAARARRRSGVNEGANQAITGRVEQVRQELAAIEDKMRALRNSNEMVLLRAGSVGQQQLEELATAAGRASVDRTQIETTYDRASALARQGASAELANVLGSPTVSSLRAQEAAAAQRVAELSSHYGPAYPGVRSAQAELSSVRAQLGGETQRIVSSLGAQLAVARAHEADIKAQLDTARKSAVTGEDARAQLDQLDKEATSRRALYQTLLERAQQTVNEPASSETPDVRVLSTAAPPASPSGPNMKIAAGLGGVAGSLIGSLFAIARIRRNDSFAGDPAAAPAAGPAAAGALRSGWFGRGPSSLPARVAAAPHGAEAQAMRDLRARVRRLGRASSPRAVLFCSAMPGDHALQTALALARVASAAGERVLLIETDVGKPALARLPGVEAGDLLAALGGADWRELPGMDDRLPLQMLAASRPAPDADAILSGNAFQNLLVDGAAEFDLTVLIGPPAATPGAVMLARRADAALLLVDGASKRAAAQGVIEDLASASRDALDVVIVGR